jgi:hypothetical protein
VEGLAGVLAVWVATGTTLAAASEMGRLAEMAEGAAPALTRSLELAWHALSRNPSLMLAVAVASAVPLVAIAAALLRAIGRRMRRWSARRQFAPDAASTANRPPNLAWLQVENRGMPPLALGELVRIGRSTDCDLALGGSGVADIHALIQRTPDCEFIIFDVSDDESGLAVNGKPSRQCRLRDGDRIEIGTACVVFHARWSSRVSGPPAYA